MRTVDQYIFSISIWTGLLILASEIHAFQLPTGIWYVFKVTLEDGVAPLLRLAWSTHND